MVNKSLSKITIFVKIYLLGIFIFSAFRLLLFILNEDKVNDNEMLDVFRAFIMGVRFDIVISGYILSLPFLFISIFTFFSSASPIIKKVSVNIINDELLIGLLMNFPALTKYCLNFR